MKIIKLILPAILLILFLFFPAVPSTAKSTICLSKTYSTLEIGKSITYKVKGLKKGQYCRFSSTSPAIASIQKKTGKMTGKKAGKTKIKIYVYNKNGSSKKIFSNTVRILEPVIPHVDFQVDFSMNPWNHRIKLSSSRILLKKEVKQTKIKITQQKNPDFSVYADFFSLSSDGKKITYQVSKKEKKKLCPKNGSKDGVYILSSSSFSKKYSFNYQERISSCSLAGFIFSCQKKPVGHAKITCRTATDDKIVYSDSHGRYECRNLSSIKQIIVEKEGYDKKVIPSVSLSANGTRCENVFLHSKSESSACFGIRVTNEDNTGISHASVYLFSESSCPFPEKIDDLTTEDALLSGETDAEGNLLFYQDKFSLTSSPHILTTLSAAGKKLITYGDKTDFSAQNCYMLPADFNKNNTYCLLLKKEDYHNPHGNIQPILLRFNPNDFCTDTLLFSFSCTAGKYLDIGELSIMLDGSFPLSALPAKYAYSIFSTEQAKPVYTNEISADVLSLEHANTSLQLPVCLNDGTWQIRLQALDETGNIIASSPLHPFEVSKHTTNISLTLYPSLYGKFLTYGAYTLPENSTASFCLYEKNETGYAYMDTFTTPVLQGKPYSLKKASFIIPYLCPHSSYILLPQKDTLFCKEIITFTPALSSLSLSQKEAETSIPLATIPCTSGSFSEIAFPADKPQAFSSPFVFCSIEEQELSVIEDCPLSVVVFSDKNGSFLFSQIISQNQILPSAKYIVDIYENKKVLKTSQDSYQ